MKCYIPLSPLLFAGCLLCIPIALHAQRQDTSYSKDGRSRTIRFFDADRLTDTHIAVYNAIDEYWSDSLTISYYKNGNMRWWYSHDQEYLNSLAKHYTPDGNLYSQQITRKNAAARTTFDIIHYYINGKLAYENDLTSGKPVIRVKDSTAYAAFLQVFPVTGARVFQENCASCHSPYKKLTAPALACISQRRSDAWLVKWISSATEMLKTDASARKLFREYNGQLQPDFRLTPVEMRALLDYMHTF